MMGTAARRTLVDNRLKKNLVLGMILALGLASTDCFPRRGRYYAPYRPSFGARLLGAVIAGAIVGTAVAVAANDAPRYHAGACTSRMFHNGRWHFYCQDRWAYYEGGAWYTYPPSAPMADAPPPPPADAPPPPALPPPPAPPPVQ